MDALVLREDGACVKREDQIPAQVVIHGYVAHVLAEPLEHGGLILV